MRAMEESITEGQPIANRSRTVNQLQLIEHSDVTACCKQRVSACADCSALQEHTSG